MCKVEKRGFTVVEHGFQAVGAAACEDGFHVVLVNVQAGAKRADKPCRAGETRQLLHFIQQEQSGAACIGYGADELGNAECGRGGVFPLYAQAESFDFVDLADKRFGFSAGLNALGKLL